jgi:hypothetical protein
MSKIKPDLPAMPFLLGRRRMHQHTAPVALLWDESHLWGLLLHRALQALGAPVTLLKADRSAQGSLRGSRPGTLIVPGGWAKLKSLALGEDGRDAIRDYVRGGGRYLGFCGGAGLALARNAARPFWTCAPGRANRQGSVCPISAGT